MQTTFMGQKITKMQAAEVMATDVNVWARERGAKVTKDLVEARISEWRGLAGQDTYKGACAHVATVRTTLRLALATERQMSR